MLSCGYRNDKVKKPVTTADTLSQVVITGEKVLCDPRALSYGWTGGSVSDFQRIYLELGGISHAFLPGSLHIPPRVLDLVFTTQTRISRSLLYGKMMNLSDALDDFSFLL